MTAFACPADIVAMFGPINPLMLKKPMWMPRLVIRGKTSDLLLRETVAHMAESAAVACEVPRTRQAPALVDPVQIDVIPVVSGGLK